MAKRQRQTRRRFLAAAGVASTATLAGCNSLFGDGGGEKPTLEDFRGDDLVSERSEPGGESIEDLPDLEGELSIYLGGGEGGRYVDLIDLFNQYYDGFEAVHQTQPSSQQANAIVDEHDSGTTQADVYWAVDAGSLAYVTEQGATTQLSSDTVSAVESEQYRPDNHWVGVAGRSRAIPYNTDQFSESDIPTSIDAFADDDSFAGTLGWAPSYSAFQGFVTAMRELRGDDATREWLNGVLGQEPTQYESEYDFTNRGIVNGEVGTGFSNHYYALIALSDDENAPIDLAFTENDAGSLVNVAGASVIDGANDPDLAELFIRHLLSAEAQEFFATHGFAYPMIPDVDPVGPLPHIEELNPPDLDLQALSEVQGTLDLMRDVGINV